MRNPSRPHSHRPIQSHRQRDEMFPEETAINEYVRIRLDRYIDEKIRKTTEKQLKWNTGFLITVLLVMLAVMVSGWFYYQQSKYFEVKKAHDEEMYKVYMENALRTKDNALLYRKYLIEYGQQDTTGREYVGKNKKLLR
jgi:hypothetical protein